MLETLRGLFPAGTACSLEEPEEKTTYNVYNFQKPNSPLSLLHKHCGQVWHLHCGKYLVQIWGHVALLQEGRPQVGALGPFRNLTSDDESVK